MMKNVEWEATSYLKQSKYGLGTTDIEVNTNRSYLTETESYKNNINQSII